MVADDADNLAGVYQSRRGSSVSDSSDDYLHTTEDDPRADYLHTTEDEPKADYLQIMEDGTTTEQPSKVSKENGDLDYSVTLADCLPDDDPGRFVDVRLHVHSAEEGGYTKLLNNHLTSSTNVLAPDVTRSPVGSNPPSVGSATRVIGPQLRWNTQSADAVPGVTSHQVTSNHPSTKQPGDVETTTSSG